MNSLLPELPAQQGVWERYRSNLPRYCIGVSRYLQAQMMHTLQEELGHTQLRINYEPFITLIGDEGARLTELAQWLAISKQACNQTVNQMEEAGYLERRPDPQDGRAKRVMLTEKAEVLVRQGARLVGEVEQEFARLIGSGEVAMLSALLSRLYDGLELPGLRVDALLNTSPRGNLLGLLPRLTDYMMQRLMELNISKGHSVLKMSYAQVLSLIGPDGGRIQQMARLQEVSKQAIGAIATELEELGYIARLSDANDARQVVLQFTDAGWQLLSDSVTSMDELEAELEAILGTDGLSSFQELAGELYHALHIEDEIFETMESSGQVDLKLLAARLNRQLGKEGAVRLASLLVSE
jgi:DNA-binding MarR family transcriptional regulator